MTLMILHLPSEFSCINNFIFHSVRVSATNCFKIKSFSNLECHYFFLSCFSKYSQLIWMPGARFYQSVLKGEKPISNKAVIQVFEIKHKSGLCVGLHFKLKYNKIFLCTLNLSIVKKCHMTRLHSFSKYTFLCSLLKVGELSFTFPIMSLGYPRLWH